FDGVGEVGDRDRTPSFHVEQGVGVEGEQIGGIANQTLLEEQVDRLVPEVLDVHPAPPGEMEQPLTEPRWACEATGAARDRLAFGPDDGVAAERALLGHRPYPLLTGP